MRACTRATAHVKTFTPAFSQESDRNFSRDMHERPRAMAQEALQPKRYSSQPLAKADVAYIGDESGRNGFIAAVATGLLSGGAVYGLNEFSTTFRRALGCLLYTSPSPRDS